MVEFSDESETVWLLQFKCGIPKEKVGDFFEWALGEKWINTPVAVAPILWNERHGSLFILKGDDNIGESLVKMGKAYVEEKVKRIGG